MLVTDVNEDGNLDLLGVGNEYGTEPLTGWYDAGVGTCLLGNGIGNFSALPISKSGFLVDKDAKAFAEVRLAGGQTLYVVTQNQDSLRLLTSGVKKPVPSIRLRPGDSHALTPLPSGKTRKTEFYWGNGYLSQSSRTITPTGGKTNYIVDNKGVRRPL